ncbi:MAG: sorbosone dehydrogenase family protein [Candidatus Melainabacteria bacterium]|nr:sorbosone dehydrogenase family protein [Candidatus Melainabacteria bacterium]
MLVRLFLACALVLLAFCPASQASPPINLLKPPPGFKVSVYTPDVPGARAMALGEKGTLFVGSITFNQVYAVTDTDGDGSGDRVRIIARDLNHPNGVAFKDGALYVGEIHRVIRFDDIESRLDNPPAPVVVNDSFPKEEWHGYKYIRFSPDGWLYVPVGAPCNVCEKADERFATLMRMRPDGKNLEIFARGIRNTVGFDWDPVKGEIWFTDNGRDHLGDNLPPDELNHASRAGLHFGFPYRYGKDIPDPEFGYKKPRAARFEPCAMPLGAHVAALGIRFYRGEMFPSIYRERAFICEHGSWNRSTRSGYRVSMVTVKDGKATRYEGFMDGFLKKGENGDEPWGRPVDLCLMPDGSLLVSDDYAGAVYRVRYEGLNGQETHK